MMGKPTVAALRAQHGLSQQDLAEMAGVLKVRIAQHETAARRLTLDARTRVAEAFGLVVEDIDWEDGAVPGSKIVYELHGHTGERDDAQSWIVGTYESKASADRIKGRIERWLDRRLMLWGSPVIAPWRERDAAVCELDAGFVCDYTGVRYEVVPRVVEGARA